MKMHKQNALFAGFEIMVGKPPTTYMHEVKRYAADPAESAIGSSRGGTETIKPEDRP